MSEHEIALFEEYSEKDGLLLDLPHPRKIFFTFMYVGYISSSCIFVIPLMLEVSLAYRRYKLSSLLNTTTYRRNHLREVYNIHL